MELASEMFRAAFSNATGSDVTTFLSTAQQIVESLATTQAALKGNQFGEFITKDALIRFAEVAKIEHPALFMNIPCDLSLAQRGAYCIALQGLRITALVHDLGHPPFSHVTEHAVKKVIDSFGNENSTLPNEIVLGALKKKLSESGKAPHESLTLSLFAGIVSGLEASVQRHSSKSQVKPIDSHGFTCLAFAFAEGILTGGNFERPDLKNISNSEDFKDIFGCLRLLEDGPLDCDRLDYVQRDVILSGIRSSGLRIQRLIENLTLVKLKTTNKWAVVPDIKSLRSLEEFLEWRAELYRTVIYHHHVVRTDSFFEEIVFNLCSDSHLFTPYAWHSKIRC
jgi:uncharacterized protein